MSNAWDLNFLYIQLFQVFIKPNIFFLTSCQKVYLASFRKVCEFLYLLSWPQTKDHLCVQLYFLFSKLTINLYYSK